MADLSAKPLLSTWGINSENGYQIFFLKCTEKAKNLDTTTLIWDFLIECKADRHSKVIIVGGGILCDMAAFACATFQRGIRFDLMPTTLLAMVDAAIGGKTGINLRSFKNYLGVFALPENLWVYTDFLKTLSDDDIENGMAEVVKHALIGDTELWSELSKKEIGDLNFREVIERSIRFKTEVVSEDFKETGKRKILNFGHTLGHALESWYLQNRPDETLPHGRAVATGMLAESLISFNLGLLNEDELLDIEEYLSGNFKPIYLPQEAIPEVAELCLKDKKNKDGLVYPVLLNGIGKPIYDRSVSSELLIQGLDFACPKEGISPENE